MAAIATAVKQTEPFDVCIVGAGPCGLSVLSALNNREGTLTEKQVQESQRRRTARKSRDKAPRACVVDPGGGFLAEWNGRFDALDIGLLRSPAWAQPDFFSDNALLEYAWQKGRDAELRALDDLAVRRPSGDLARWS